MKFSEESAHDCHDEIVALTKDNVEESGYVPARLMFKPVMSAYLSMYDAGMLRVFTVRDAEVLVGYCVMIIANHHHYGGLRWATQDVIYIKPRYRGLTSVKFIKWVDEMLLDDGVMVVSRSVSIHRDYSRVLKSMGYEQVETVYALTRGNDGD